MSYLSLALDRALPAAGAAARAASSGSAHHATPPRAVSRIAAACAPLGREECRDRGEVGQAHRPGCLAHAGEDQAERGRGEPEVAARLARDLMRSAALLSTSRMP